MVDCNVVPFDVVCVVAVELNEFDLNLFSATCRNLERVSLEFHWPIRLDRFLVVVTGVFVAMLTVLAFSTLVHKYSQINIEFIVNNLTSALRAHLYMCIDV